MKYQFCTHFENEIVFISNQVWEQTLLLKVLLKKMSMKTFFGLYSNYF